MNKCKLVSVTSLMVGSIQLLMAFIQFTFVLPRISQLFTEFNQLANLTTSYILLLLLALLGFTNLFLSLKVFHGEGQEKYFLFTALFVTVSFFVSGFIVSLMVGSLIYPVYNLGS